MAATLLARIKWARLLDLSTLSGCALLIVFTQSFFAETAFQALTTQLIESVIISFLLLLAWIQITGNTPGESILGLERVFLRTGERITLLNFFRADLRLKNSKSSSFLFSGLAIAALLFEIIFLSYDLSKHHPLLKRPDFLDLTSDAASASLMSDQYAPFFFTWIALPKRTADFSPSFHLTYREGPPAQFIDRIQMRLSENAWVEFEGPRTPKDVQFQNVEYCFSDIGFQKAECRDLQAAVFDQHLGRRKRLNPRALKWGWFQSEKNALQGFYTDSVEPGGLKTLRRVVILPSGRHQMITLYLKNEKPEQSEKTENWFNALLSKSLSYNSLDEAKAASNSWLKGVDLQKIEASSTGDALFEKLSFVQAELIGRISIDPAQIDPYFHFAGVTVLIAKQYAKMTTPSKPRFSKTLEAAYLYAQDVVKADVLKNKKRSTQADTELKQIENMITQAKKVE